MEYRRNKFNILMENHKKYSILIEDPKENKFNILMNDPHQNSMFSI